MSDWKKFINVNGNFELPNYIYRTINDLMKQSLDMGTLLSDDPHKLRAYKEQTKKLFKNKWNNLAQSLEFFGIIEECSCISSKHDFANNKDIYCDVCKGARYIISSALSADDAKLEEIYNKEYSLVEFTERKNFKPYEQLKARLDKVLGFEGESLPNIRAEDVELPRQHSMPKTKAPVIDSGSEDLDYFKSLAEHE